MKRKYFWQQLPQISIWVEWQRKPPQLMFSLLSRRLFRVKMCWLNFVFLSDLHLRLMIGVWVTWSSYFSVHLQCLGTSTLPSFPLCLDLNCQVEIPANNSLLLLFSCFPFNCLKYILKPLLSHFVFSLLLYSKSTFKSFVYETVGIIFIFIIIIIILTYHIRLSHNIIKSHFVPEMLIMLYFIILIIKCLNCWGSRLVHNLFQLPRLATNSIQIPLKL